MKQFFRLPLATICAVLLLAPLAQAQNWKSDPVHSGVHYIVRHGFTPMMGSFKSFNVEMTWDAEAPEKATIKATVDPASVEMSIDKLSEHLKGPDFFDVENHPEWTFVSKEIQEDDGRYMAVGDLTVHGVTKQMVVPFEFKGAKETKNGQNAGFVGEFSIDRTAFGILRDPDGKNLGKEVKIMVFLEMNTVK